MAQTPEEYFNPDNNYLGNYQYTKLSEIINNFDLQSNDPMSHIHGIGRTLITLYAKAAIRQLYRSTGKEIRAIELSIGDDLVFPLPQDYVNYVRVSKATANNVLQPLDINRNLNVAKTYLQDNEYKLLFDSNGDTIEADGNNLTNKPYRTFEVAGIGLGGQFQLDTSAISKNGEFTINERKGVIYFGSALQGCDIVLEYVSDGVEWERIHESEITFHKNLTEALNDLIYFKAIEYRNNVPANEKQRAENKFKATEHQASILFANFDLKAIEKVWRKGNVWVK
jgi:hypothetical protein